MTGPQLEALVLNEIRRARLHLRFEVKRNVIGCFLLLWNDLAWVEGIGGRRFLARDPDVRRREASIAVLPLHSRVPRISWQGEDGGTTDLWLPPRAGEPVVAALVAHALAQVAPTGRRRQVARRRLREAGVRLADFSRKPSYARPSSP